MVASCRAGRSLPQAIEDVAEKVSGPAGQEFGVIAREYKQGGLSIEEALQRTSQRLNVEMLTLATSAMIINNRYGGELLNILERISESMRELNRLQKKIHTETAEVRMQEHVVMFAAPFFALLVCLLDPSIFPILAHTTFGNAILVIVAGLIAISYFWIHKIVKSTI
jgi:tight adherence protein B